MKTYCNLCPWESRNWMFQDHAGCEATWHVYEEHHDEWMKICGDRPPLDPDPRPLLKELPELLEG